MMQYTCDVYNADADHPVHLQLFIMDSYFPLLNSNS
jgi:hypothetical protein